MADKGYIWATGRRKCSVARVRIKKGSGNIIINSIDMEKYFGNENYKNIIRQPLEATSSMGVYDIFVNVSGGGKSGQAGAIRHGISRALCLAEGDNRPALKANGYLTRDSRMVERKKYGQRGARRRFQFSKR